MSNKFDKKLIEKILPRFNSAKEWSDLMTIMKNLKENLVKYDNCSMAKLQVKDTLSKRLAQCLNPSLPAGLHETTLETYDIIFENIRKNESNNLGDNLGYFSSGLFPFFQYASVPNKSLFLNLIKKHYLEINDVELQIALSGFLVSILPGLEDNNEILIKTIKEIFAKARQKVGESNFFGILWAVLLRTTRVRLAGLRYLTDAIPPYKILFDKENYREEYIQNFYPNLQVLVINSLISGK